MTQHHHQVERLAFTVADALRTGVFAHKNALYAAINRGDIARGAKVGAA